MIRYVMLGIATVLLVFFVVCEIQGKRFYDLYANLDEKEHPLKDFYGIGFFLNSLPIFALKGNLERDLKRQSKLYWDNIYYEYYAVLAWAQFLTYALLAITVGACFAAVLPGPLSFMSLVMAGLVLAGAYNLIIDKMKEAVENRREECEYEFPSMISKLGLLVSSGSISRDAWYKVANGREGGLYDLMKRSCNEMDNGASEVEAIHHFGMLSDSDEIKKFTSAMIQNLERGSSNLASYLLGQSSEMWVHKRQLALQRGEVAAGKLIIPLGISFAGIIMVIVAAVMQSLSF